MVICFIRKLKYNFCFIVLHKKRKNNTPPAIASFLLGSAYQHGLAYYPYDFANVLKLFINLKNSYLF